MNTQQVLDASLAANATTLATGEVSQIFKTGFKNSIKVRIVLKHDDRNWLIKNTTFPLTFVGEKVITNDHSLLCAMREVIRDTFEDTVHIKTTNVRTLVVGAAAREIRSYSNNPNVHYYVYGKENKDYDRIIRSALEDITKSLLTKARKNNYIANLPPNAVLDTTKTRPAVKRYLEMQTLLDDYNRLHKLPNCIHLAPTEAEVLIFEDSIYNYTPKSIVKLFNDTKANIAFGYGIFPLELIFTDMPQNKIYHYREFRCANLCDHLKTLVNKCRGQEIDFVCETCGLGTKRSVLTFRNGYANGYEHNHASWRMILESPVIHHDGTYLAVEIMSRVGCMMSFKIYRCNYAENIVRTFELLEHEKYVRVLDLWGSVDHKSCKMKKLKYFTVRERELFEVYNYMLGLDLKSVSIPTAVTQIKRKMGGIYMSAKDHADKWDLPMHHVYPLAIAVVMQVNLMSDKIDNSIKKANPTGIYEGIKKFIRNIGYYSTYPIQLMLEWIFHEHLTDKIFVMPEHNCVFHQRAIARPVRSVETPEMDSMLTLDGVNVEEVPTCPFCAMMQGRIGSQIMQCDHKIDSDVTWSLTEEQLKDLENRLIDDDNDPPGLKAVKMRAKQAMPKTAFSYVCRAEVICGPPGTGKSTIARLIAEATTTIIMAPFTKLRSDYVKIKDEYGQEISYDFSTNHRAVASTGHSVIILDEFTSFDYALFACAVYNNRPDIVYIVGDEKQTKVREPSEGLYIPNHIENFNQLSKHTLRVNFRNAVDVIATLNRVYGYNMIPACVVDPIKFPRVDRSIWVEDTTSSTKIEAAAQMCFTHASAEAWLENRTLTVRTFQGSTVDNAVVYATKLDNDKPMIDELGIVALSRHRKRLIIKVHDCPESKNFLSKIGYSSEEVYLDFLKHLDDYFDVSVKSKLDLQVDDPDFLEVLGMKKEMPVVSKIEYDLEATTHTLDAVISDEEFYDSVGSSVVIDIATPGVVLPSPADTKPVIADEPLVFSEKDLDLLEYVDVDNNFQVLQSKTHQRNVFKMLFSSKRYKGNAELKLKVKQILKDNRYNWSTDKIVYEKLSFHPIMKSKYDLKRATSRYQDIQAIAYFPQKPTSYLDLGCSDGSLSDVVHSALELESTKFFMSDLEDKRTFSFGRFIQGSLLTNYEVIPDNSLDMVTAMMTLHHVSNLLSLLMLLRRKMSKNGRLIIREHNVENSSNEAKELNIYHGFCDLVWDKLEKPLSEVYPVYRDINQWLSLFEDLGFVCIARRHNSDKFYSFTAVFKKVDDEEADSCEEKLNQMESDEDQFDEKPKKWVKKTTITHKSNSEKVETTVGKGFAGGKQSLSEMFLSSHCALVKSVPQLNCDYFAADQISRHQEFYVSLNGNGDNYIRKLSALPEDDLVKRSEYFSHLNEMVPHPLMDTREKKDFDADEFSSPSIDCPKLEHPMRDSHLYLKEPFAMKMVDDIPANNDYTANVVVGEFRDCEVELDDLIMPVNQRGHVVNTTWEFKSIGPGAGSRFTDKNPFQEVTVMGQRYNNPKPAREFGKEAREFADRMVDCYYEECKIQNCKLKLDEASMAKKLIEFLQSAAVKHYYAQFRGYEYKEVAARIRFKIKTIYKPANSMKEEDLYKAGQGISAWHPDLLIYFCFAWRLLAEHDRVTERNDEQMRVFTDNGLNIYEFMQNVRNAAKRLGDLPVRHGIADQKMFDSLQNEWSQYLEQKYWLKMGVSQQFLNEYYQFRQYAIMIGKFTYCSIMFEKLSGEPGTLVNNGVIAKVVGNYVVRGQGPCVLVYKGDDFDKLQMDLHVDDAAMAEVKSFTVMQMRVHISERGEFCGYIMSGTDIIPNIVRKMDKIIAKPYKDYKQFTVYQESLRDYEKELRIATKPKVLGAVMDLYGLCEEEAERIFDAIISMGHINEEQWNELVSTKQMYVGVPVYSEVCKMNTEVVF